MSIDHEPLSERDQLLIDNAGLHTRLGLYFQNLETLLRNEAFCGKCADLVIRLVLAPDQELRAPAGETDPAEPQ